MMAWLGIQRLFLAFGLGRLGETGLPVGKKQFQHNLKFHLKALIVRTYRRTYQPYAGHNDQVVTPAFRRCAFQAEASIHFNHRRAEVFIAAGIPHTGTDRDEYMEHRLAPSRIALGRFPPGLRSALLHGYKLERWLCTIRQAAYAQFGAQTPLPFPAAADDSGQQHLKRFRLMLAVIFGRARMRKGRRTRRRTGQRTRRWALLLASRRAGRWARRRTGRRARRRAWQRTWHTFVLVHRRPCGGTRLTTFRLLGLPARRAVTLMVHHC
jgi:hypothetical protein